MTLSEISIRRPVFAWMLMFALIVFGTICFQRMGISQMPDINFPVVNVSLRLDNAAPEVMEAPRFYSLTCRFEGQSPA